METKIICEDTSLDSSGAKLYIMSKMELLFQEEIYKCFVLFDNEDVKHFDELMIQRLWVMNNMPKLHLGVVDDSYAEKFYIVI